MLRMKTAKPSLSEHRLTRLIAWGRAMLAWLAAMLTSDIVATRRRLHRFAMLEHLPRFIECLLVIRACALVFPRKRPRATARPGNAPAGFARRRLSGPQVLRAAIGLAMRRRLRPRGLSARLAIWFEALRDLDAFAAPIVRRAKRRLTRLCAIVPVRPPQRAVCSVAALAAPLPTDTS